MSPRDPKSNPSISGYSCFSGNPVWNSDPYGDPVIISDRMRKPKHAMKAFELLKKSETFKKMIARYDIGRSGFKEKTGRLLFRRRKPGGS